MSQSLPYIASPGALPKLLEKIKAAAVPAKFDRPFIENTIGMKGGNGASCIPFLKRIGFLASDGTPTDIYKDYRQPKLAGSALARALKVGYAPLFQANEKIHEATAEDLKGAFVHATGAEQDSRSVELMVTCFNHLKKGANFTAPEPGETDKVSKTTPPEQHQPDNPAIHGKTKFGLSYTIYLNLPNTSDPAVYNAIFKALRENLMGDLQ